MNEILYSLIGAVVTVVAARFGIPVPGLPTPKVPKAPDPAAPDSALVDALQHLLKARAGDIKLDDMDREILRALKPVLDALLADK